MWSIVIDWVNGETSGKHTKAHDCKDVHLLFSMYTSSANVKSFQLTLRSCFWFSWIQNPHRQQQTGAGLGAADWVEPRMLKTTIRQCSWSLASELSLPSLPRRALREEHRHQCLLGEESEYSSIVCLLDSTCTQAATPCVPIPHASEVKQCPGSQPSLEVTSATSDIRTLHCQVFLWLFPWCGFQEAAAVFGKTGSHRMVNRTVYLMSLTCWFTSTRISSWCPSMLFPLCSVLFQVLPWPPLTTESEKQPGRWVHCGCKLNAHHHLPLKCNP